MTLSKTFWDILCAILVCLVCVLAMMVLLIVFIAPEQESSGSVLVDAMYDFATPAELVANQVVVQDMLVPEEWERLQLDNTLRVTNTYFKFKYSASEVVQKWERNQCICYQLLNEHIGDWRRYLLFYDVNEAGKLCNIREYEILWARGSASVDDF